MVPTARMTPGFGGLRGGTPGARGARWRAARSALQHGPCGGCSAHFHLFSAFFPSRFVVPQLAGSCAGARLCCAQPVGSPTRCLVPEAARVSMQLTLGSPVPIPGVEVPRTGAAPSLAPQRGAEGSFCSHLLLSSLLQLLRALGPVIPGPTSHGTQRKGTDGGGWWGQQKNPFGGFGREKRGCGTGRRTDIALGFGLQLGTNPVCVPAYCKPFSLGGFSPLQVWGRARQQLPKQVSPSRRGREAAAGQLSPAPRSLEKTHGYHPGCD